jgi:acetyl-CoA carboxylase carboxyl transferase subunit alpha
MDYVQHMMTDFVELHGDRIHADDRAIIGGLGTIDGKTFMLIGQEKGDNTKSRQHRNFGMPRPEGYRKALRLMKMAEKFNKPVITLIDTPGAYPGIGAEERGQAEAIARNLFEMTTLNVPVISYVIGEGASGGAIGIGVGDRIFMLENTWYSVISPESCSSILWRSWDYKKQAAEQLRLTAKDMLENKIIDGILQEPLGGAHRNKEAMASILKQSILDNYQDLKDLKKTERIQNRIEKYEAIGKYDTIA